MKTIIRDIQLIQQFDSQMNGVFSTYDLQQLFGMDNKVLLYRRLKTLCESDVIQSFCRGIFVTPQVNLQKLTTKLIPESYISLGSILSDKLIIGTTPGNRVYCIKPGRSKIYSNDSYEIIFYGINSDYFNGYTNLNGVNYASAEKAFIDTAYLYLKGVPFYFDIYSDIQYDQLDRNILSNILTQYRNPKLIRFVEGLLND
ncbi:MAG: hypothetical protein OCC49_07480 [Fibrobacterales bacterium]